MKRMMLILGLLDLAVIATYSQRLPGYVRNFGLDPWLNLVCLVILLSFALSAYGFLRQCHWVFPLTYAQFPFRIALAFLSFSFLAELILPEQPSVVFHQSVWISCVALEGIRFGLTVMIHRDMRGQQPSHALNLTRPPFGG